VRGFVEALNQSPLSGLSPRRLPCAVGHRLSLVKGLGPLEPWLLDQALGLINPSATIAACTAGRSATRAMNAAKC
jgi:hypothetical protein